MRKFPHSINKFTLNFACLFRLDEWLNVRIADFGLCREIESQSYEVSLAF